MAAAFPAHPELTTSAVPQTPGAVFWSDDPGSARLNASATAGANGGSGGSTALVYPATDGGGMAQVFPSSADGKPAGSPPEPIHGPPSSLHVIPEVSLAVVVLVLVLLVFLLLLHRYRYRLHVSCLMAWEAQLNGEGRSGGGQGSEWSSSSRDGGGAFLAGSARSSSNSSRRGGEGARGTGRGGMSSIRLGGNVESAGRGARRDDSNEWMHVLLDVHGFREAMGEREFYVNSGGLGRGYHRGARGYGDGRGGRGGRRVSSGLDLATINSLGVLTVFERGKSRVKCSMRVKDSGTVEVVVEQTGKGATREVGDGRREIEEPEACNAEVVGAPDVSPGGRKATGTRALQGERAGEITAPPLESEPAGLQAGAHDQQAGVKDGEEGARAAHGVVGNGWSCVAIDVRVREARCRHGRGIHRGDHLGRCGCDGTCHEEQGRATAGGGSEQGLPEGLSNGGTREGSVRESEVVVSCEDGECAVCLCEYMEGDVLRTLNKCHHHFHQACIDEWLSSSTSCPLCRTAMVPERFLFHQPREEAAPFAPAMLPRPLTVAGAAAAQAAAAAGGVVAVSGAAAAAAPPLRHPQTTLLAVHPSISDPLTLPGGGEPTTQSLTQQQGQLDEQQREVTQPILADQAGLVESRSEHSGGEEQGQVLGQASVEHGGAAARGPRGQEQQAERPVAEARQGQTHDEGIQSPVSPAAATVLHMGPGEEVQQVSVRSVLSWIWLAAARLAALGLSR
ncbi:hypothetical protein CLOM_g20156 [Closterium sp. NIES-68]|nr:hypothetical protein CLOM_g20156 [Closterium sp. NIES-68]GJP77173.1 hypothetical protein CLOP_g7602 [Closterium sp. NIES-67]